MVELKSTVVNSGSLINFLTQSSSTPWYTGIDGNGSIDFAIIRNSNRWLTVHSDGVITIPQLTANRAIYTDANKNLISSAVTDTELSYLSGVTSNIQTQINNISFDLNLTPNRALETNANGDLISSVITNTELNYLDGVSSNIQTQLHGKQITITSSSTITPKSVDITKNSTNGLKIRNDGPGGWDMVELTSTFVNGGSLIKFLIQSSVTPWYTGIDGNGTNYFVIRRDTNHWVTVQSDGVITIP